MKRKILAMLLAVIMTVALLPVSALAEGIRSIDLSGIIGLFARLEGTKGENGTPVRSGSDFYLDEGDGAYHIDTAEGWNTFCASLEAAPINGFANQTVKLGADIGSVEAPVTRMAGDDNHPFKGTFDGGNHTLTVYINTSTLSAAPFYSIDGATIENLKVAGSVFGKIHSGGLVSRTNGTGTIQNCVVSTSVSISTGTQGYMGGIVGHALSSDLTLTGCVFNGTLTSSANYVGGLVGWTDDCTLNMTDCLFAGSVTAAANAFHPVCCHNVAIASEYNGVFYTVMPTVENTAKADSNTGVCVYPNSSAPSHLGNAGTDYGFMQMYENGVKFGDTYYCAANPADFNLEEDGAYHIYTEEGWNVFCNCLNNNPDYNRFSGKTVYLESSISVSTPAGYSAHDFCGTFDGKNNTLTFTYSETSGTEGIAPFSYISVTKANPSDTQSSPALIKDLNVICSISTNGMYASGLIGRAWGEVNVINCTVSGTITTSVKYAAGFLGQNNCTSAYIEGCVSSVKIISSVNGDGTHGGFIAVPGAASCSSTIKNSVFNGKLLTTNGTTSCGGFLGWYGGGFHSVENCVYAPAAPESGETPITEQAEAFVRWNTTDTSHAPTITNCYYTETLGSAQGMQARRLVKGDGIASMDAFISGEGSVSYLNSGISVRAGRVALNDVFYFKPSETVSLTLSHVPAGNDYDFTGYSVSAGSLTQNGDNYTLVMPDEDVTVTADFSLLPLTYLGQNGETVTVPGSGYTLLTSGMTELTTGTYAVNGSFTFENRITVSGNVTLVLMNNCYLVPKKGISVNEDNSLTIAAQSTVLGTMGEIETPGNTISYDAAIGGDREHSCGSITVYGGHLRVFGGSYAAGLGGGYKSTGGSIAIYGGIVYAVGGDNAAGIGGGYKGGLDTIIIAGGQVTCRTLFGAGGNFSGTPGTITLGWTNANDFIDIRSSVNGSVSFDRLMKIEGETDYLTDGADVGNKKLVPFTDGYLVVFHANGGEGEMADQLFSFNAAQNLAANTFTRTGYGLIGWALIADGGVVYTDGQSITTNITDQAGGIVHLYAVWQQDVAYLNENGETVTVPGNRYTLLTSGMTELTSGWYALGGNLTFDTRITVTGDVKLILVDGFTLNANRGVSVNENNSFTVYAQSTAESTMGRLNAELSWENSADNDNAGIGGTGGSAGSITIVGGYLYVTGGSYGAGIGGGNGGSGGNITIYGGKVVSEDYYSGAGIGGGNCGSGGNITIYGGNVVSKGNYSGAGIGGGNRGSGGRIIISGGSVSAQSEIGAGIGGGYNNVTNQTIEITGGTVSAESFEGAGIGGGSGENSMEGDGFGDGGYITISGGTVTAVNKGRGAAIGGGYNASYANISISGGKVTANASEGSAIGYGFNFDGHSSSFSLGWSDPDDFIDIKGSVDYYLVSFNVLMRFDNGTEPISDGANVSNKKLVPYTGYIVVFYANGGTGEMADQTFAWDEAKNLAANAFTFGDYAFSGWATSPTGGVVYSDGQSVKNIGEQGKELHLYAVWGSLTYIGESGEVTLDYGEYTLLTSDVTELENGKVYAVSGNLTVKARITVSGDVTLVLMDNCTFTAQKGITVNTVFDTHNSLTIAAQSTDVNTMGKLIIDNVADYCAGIGGDNTYSRLGLITVVGGNIEVTGGDYCAGIGGDDYGSSGTIKIYGGKINATGGCYGAGIGGNRGSDGGSITISGGDVTAQAGMFGGAGIGGGGLPISGSYGGSGGNISIEGGTINAQGNEGAGIGGGECAGGGTIIITGGDITANSKYGAGMGGGEGGSGGNITIEGGTVRAKSTSGGAGIGGGDTTYDEAYSLMTGDGGSITISGGTITAVSTSYGAAIGGGNMAGYTEINILGGKVSANASNGSGSAIGCGTGGSSTAPIEFGWTDPDDYIDINGYVTPNNIVTFVNPMMYEGGTEIIADNTNVSMRKLVPYIAYTVNFHANDGTENAVQRTYLYGSADKLTARETLGITNASMIFIGWNTAADGTGMTYADEALLKDVFGAASGTFDLYALWRPVGSPGFDTDGSSVKTRERTQQDGKTDLRFRLRFMYNGNTISPDSIFAVGARVTYTHKGTQYTSGWMYSEDIKVFSSTSEYFEFTMVISGIPDESSTEVFKVDSCIKYMNNGVETRVNGITVSGTVDGAPNDDI